MRGRMRSFTMGRKMAQPAKQKTLLDFVEASPQQRIAEVRAKKREEDLILAAIELIEAHPGCFTKEELAERLGVSVAVAVYVANKLIEVDMLEKRIRFEGEEGRLVYCAKRGAPP